VCPRPAPPRLTPQHVMYPACPGSKHNAGHMPAFTMQWEEGAVLVHNA
jgi:hypothetical protein